MLLQTSVVLALPSRSSSNIEELWKTQLRTLCWHTHFSRFSISWSRPHCNRYVPSLTTTLTFFRPEVKSISAFFCCKVNIIEKESQPSHAKMVLTKGIQSLSENDNWFERLWRKFHWKKKEFWVGCLKANKVFSPQRKPGPAEKNSTRKKTIFIQFWGRIQLSMWAHNRSLVYYLQKEILVFVRGETTKQAVDLK